MKITILTLGTRGDVQPYIALGRSLIKKGHQVCISTGETFKEFIEKNGIEFYKAEIDFMAILKTKEGQAIFNGGGMSIFKILKFTKEVINPAFKKSFGDFLEASKNSDLIIYHPKALASVDVAEYLKIPCISMPLVPMIYPITEFPNLALAPTKNFGKFINKLTYKVIKLAESSSIKDINEFRINTLGLNKRKIGALTYELLGKEIPIVCPVSPSLFKDVTSWENHVLVPGFFYMNLGEAKLDESVVEFLNKGEKPIVISFSSMPLKEPELFKDKLLKALKITGNRAIILTGTSGLEFGKDSNVLAIEKAPHRLLFKEAKGIIHHGGAGTMAEALLSGVPHMIMPFSVDQPFWAHRLFNLGYVLKPIKEKKLTAELLISTFENMENKNEINKAVEISKLIKTESGLENTVKYIESILYS